jgi:hypothetical protein
VRLLFAADLHHFLRQFDWLKAHASGCDAVIAGGAQSGLIALIDDGQ